MTPRRKEASVSSDLNLADISAFLLTLAGLFFYGRSTLRGPTRPPIATWLIWTMNSALLFFSFKESGAARVGLAAAYLVGCTCIFLITLKKGAWKWGVLDSACVGVAIAGALLWWLTNNPLLALGASLLVDFAGIVPTMKHSWGHPEEEDRLAWGLMYGGILMSLFAVKEWVFADYSYPLYMTISTTVVVAFVFRLRR